MKPHLRIWPSGNTYGKEFYIEAVTKTEAIRKMHNEYGKKVIISSIHEFSHHIKGQKCIWAAYRRE